ncbi:sulfur carrier protein [Nocardioides sp. BE266]|uniref:sulfur carrier protein ThiS n=1 Tax=Nocardioides sp. BE266 TaxID=2817725 RepID=UPI00285F8C42|nr:sulfur carrier protein ThiS [Nocardioides sp. BE266]MDR7252198.1 sulfur carrier protein [Nocardioides sp. BE266]
MRLTLNGVLLDADADTLHDLVGPLPSGHAVAVNHEVVPRAEHASRLLVDGDVVDVVTAVSGG